MRVKLRSVPLWLVALVWLFLQTGSSIASQISIDGPAGSAQFGQKLFLLPNGNIVAVDTAYTNAGVSKVGAVYLYDGATLTLISKLTGSSSNDQIGSGGIFTLPNNKFIVRSPKWSNGTNSAAGAVTWCSGVTGLAGAVSSANSLVGSLPNDSANSTVIVLSNGNYVVSSPYWKNGTNVSVGAATWCDGSVGRTGVISSTNSLVGTKSSDIVGNGITALPNGNYVVLSPFWNDDAGAVTWCNGSTGRVGAVSAANSITGYHGASVIVLKNGNYVLSSPYWNGFTGYAIFCSGATGSIGTTIIGAGTGEEYGSGGIIPLPNGNFVVVSPYSNNSRGRVELRRGTDGLFMSALTGATVNDRAGFDGITILSNGSYVVSSPYFSSGAATNAGAVTWRNPTSFASESISGANSLLGEVDEQLGKYNVLPLPSGNYLVWDPYWNGNSGAVTWCNGKSGRSGSISSATSLVGNVNGYAGFGGVSILDNGNYVVASPYWNKGTVTNVGAVTWCSGSTGRSGLISTANSLIGSVAYDYVGYGGVSVLANANYVVSSPFWDNGSISDVGAVTWCSGTIGRVGAVAATNSLIGSATADRVGSYVDYEWNGRFTNTVFRGSILSLSNGNYVVATPNWSDGAITNVGAITWCAGVTGTVGVVSRENSLIGTTVNDRIGSYSYNYITNFPPPQKVVPGVRLSLTALGNGDYVVASPNWSKAGGTNTGAITWGNGAFGLIGIVSSANSLIGTGPGDLLGSDGVLGFERGNFIIQSPFWDNNNIPNSGALTLAIPGLAPTGVITTNNSVIGSGTNAGISMIYLYEPSDERLFVGSPAENRITSFFYRVPQTLTFSPIPNQKYPGTVMLNAFTDSGLAVSFSLLSGPATLNGNQIDLIGPGTVAIVAYQAGSSEFIPTALTNSFNVTAALTTNTTTPIWWLIQYGFTNDFENAAMADPDGDGARTWEEYVAGTIPTNSASALKLSLFSKFYVTNSTVIPAYVWQFPGATGRFYDIQATSQLTNATWVTMPGSSNLIGIPDMRWTNYNANQYRFFRAKARF